jgi:hypothetical protein
MLDRVLPKFLSYRLGPLALAGCLAFSACANMSTMTPSEQAIEHSKQRFAMTTAEGAAVGAIGGALLGVMLGGGASNALLGASAGALAGAAAGYVVAQNNFQKSQTEDNLKVATSSAEAEANQANQDAANAQKIADEARATAASLATQYRAGQITIAQYHSSLARYDKSIATMKSLSQGAVEQAADYRKSAGLASGAGAATLNGSANQIDASRIAIEHAAASLQMTISAQPA